MTDYVGAILAGGRGSRMGRLGDSYPKPLLPVATKALIVHQLQVLRAIGIRQVFVVVSHGATQIMEMLGDGQRYDVNVQYVDQGALLGSAHAVSRLAPYINSPFVLLLGDYYFSAPGLAGMLQRATTTNTSVIAAKREPDLRALREACMLEVDPDGRIQRIIEKPIAPKGEIKGCGIYICRPEILDAVRRTPRTALRDEYELTISLDVYIQMGFPLYADEVIEWDMNFTRPDDVLQCNLIWLREHGQDNLVGTGVRMASDTQLDNVVIGDNVTIDEPAVLRDVVIFDGVQLKKGGRIEGALITPQGVIDCRHA